MDGKGRRRGGRSAAVAVVLVLAGLAGCSGPAPAPKAPSTPPPAPPAPPVPELSAASRIDQLCRSLAVIVDSEIRGFSDLRGKPAGDRAWQGRELVPSMFSCRVEGDFYPVAQYVCRGAQSMRGRPETLQPTFEATAADLDACLARPSWGERGWTRGQTFIFAAGERQILWRHGGNVQRPGIGLKIEEDIGANVWFIRLAVMTLR